MSIVNTSTGEILEPLSAMERSALTHAEAKIERNLAGFIETGEALIEVRDRRLYRDQFGTFEAYCRERWGLSRSLAYDTITASETVRAMSAIADTVPTNIGQARELSGLTPEDAAEVMQTAAEISAGPITAKVIKEARNLTLPHQTPASVDGEDPARDQGQAQSEPTEAEPAPTCERPEPIATVTGLDGKTYTRPTSKPSLRPVVNEDEWTEQDRAEELASNLARNLSLLFAVTVPERRAEYIANWSRGVQSRPVLGQNFVTPEHMRRLGDALHTFASEWENADV